MLNHSLISIFVLAALAAAAQAQHSAPAAHTTHQEHRHQMQREAEMKARGAVAMGFDQDATQHHFVLFEDGGAIEVAVKNRADTETVRSIQRHLKTIAQEFAKGMFEKPLATHAEMPPGAEIMSRLKDVLSYGFENMSGGGRVRIQTKNAEALAAVHQFLRYQIREHAPGDSTEVRSEQKKSR